MDSSVPPILSMAASSPLLRWLTMPAPTESPTTLMVVLNLSSSQSTARMMVMSSGGRPTVSRTITMVTRPAWGIPAAPMLAAVAVMEMAQICPMERERLLTWAMKMAATASYRAVPSMLMVAPIGRMNLQTRGSTLFLFSRRPMVTGRVALLEAVPNAVVNAFVMLAINLKGRVLVTIM